MPLTKKGSKIMDHMKKQYGSKKGEQVFYASRNKGTITGVDPMSSKTSSKGKSMKKDTKKAVKKTAKKVVKKEAVKMAKKKASGY